MGVVGARARHVCFVHAPVAPDVLATRLPHALSVATRDGVGWVSALAMRTRPLSGPVALAPSFAQFTVRTYVETGGEEAVYFLRVDVDTPVIARLARRLFGVAFRRVDAAVDVTDDQVAVRDHAPDGRTVYDATFERSDDVESVEEGTLDAWLVDRDTFALDDGRTGIVEHDPWRVAPVDCKVATDELLDSEAVAEPAGEPRYRYSPGADFYVTEWPSSG